MKSIDKFDEYDLMLYERFNQHTNRNVNSNGNSSADTDLANKPFPVLKPPKDCPASVPWSTLDEAHAYKIHGQTLSRLAERGGLDVKEIYINYYKLGLRDINAIAQQAAMALVNTLNNAGSKT